MISAGVGQIEGMLLLASTHYHLVALCPHIFEQEKSWTCPSKSLPDLETYECV